MDENYLDHHTDRHTTSPLGEYLDQLHKIGVVLDYQVFEVRNNPANLDHLHRKLAEAGLRHADLGLHEYFHEQNRREMQPDPFWDMAADNTEPRDTFKLTYDISKARCQPIDHHEFLSQYSPPFKNPPHGIRCKNKAADDLVAQSITRIFGNLQEYNFRRWTNDWSNYFDLGNHWWGAYLWTAIHPHGKAIWIGASTTD